MTRIGVVVFPGSLDDRDACRALKLAGFEPIRLWHEDTDLGQVEAVILPGGFSYGDYLRCGALASRSKIMEAVIKAANGGMPLLGICNGFQILTEAGLLPGALVANQAGRFTCGEQSLIVENTSTPFTVNFLPGQEVVIPIKNAAGCYIASEQMLARIEGEGQVVFRYSVNNPNGSVADIAGVCNPRGNVVGMMPHPEHAVEPVCGPEGADGLSIFTAITSWLENNDG